MTLQKFQIEASCQLSFQVLPILNLTDFMLYTDIIERRTNPLILAEESAYLFSMYQHLILN
jgi:hypothetical protein